MPSGKISAFSPIVTAPSAYNDALPWPVAAVVKASAATTTEASP